MTQNGRSCSVLLLAIVLALLVLEGEPPVDAQGRGTLSGIVTHVADGDTLDITANGQTCTIRLDGIDAPEGGQAFGREARVQLRVLAFSKPATATVLDRDRYGRTVARVIVAGRDLSEEMVRAGLAWHFVRYSPDRRLAALEQEARQQRRGLWADRSAVPPWQYRSDRGAPPNVTPPPGPPAAPVSAGPFHGNVSSRVYHAAGCPDYNCSNCTQVFSSRREAEATGYRPHNTCVVGRK
jgi:endonuclease YncB( thermonuclease family)